MALVRGCNFPDDLYYNVDDNVWARHESDETIVVGMTTYGCALSGEIVAWTAKKVGRVVDQNKSTGTIESGKWVGPVKAPVSGEIIAVNEAAVAVPSMINVDPYGAGWLIRIKPSDWTGESGSLLSGLAAAEAFEAKMQTEGFPGCA
ncbi:Glycine cleavage system H protein - like protein [Sulfuricella denitrificans skB26]|uniref:Glycine cleavage system H protein-like protein n=1 Tax=Sulfuricella denitrificans (strain DSM 22764 / NBRC 105220 / skB26) TaxID=1163617 RepID=S6B1U5_SULDS|nr:glycine cleavage system protein H [Sulfuricella denitrificans]BAN34642.1 Glycine cleavage system H protein - like protein [Sulfuricella denitrificans skB26]